MKRFDPYEELGVPRDADDLAIRAAYRRRSKETHPDAGGGEEAFKMTRLAMTVLTDPERRARFDSTGAVEDDKPDNVRAGALQVIDRHLCPMLNAFVQGGFSQQHDPRGRDVVAEIRNGVEAELASSRDGIRIGERVLEFYRDLAGRFTSDNGDDFMARAVDNQVANAEKQLQTFRDAVRVREVALEMLEHCSFERDGSWVQLSSLLVPMRAS